MIKIITAPTSELMTIAEAKEHLRVSGSSEDAYINSLIYAARFAIENYTGRALITQTLEEAFDEIPYSEWAFELHRGPVQSITSVSYYNNDTLNVLATTNYFLDDYSIFPRVCLEYDGEWPSVDYRPNNIIVRYVAGYGDQKHDVPEDIIMAAKLLVGFLYENRDDKIIRSPFRSAALPTVVSYLLNPYRLWEF